MSKWVIGDIFKITICLGIGWLLLEGELNADNRPEYIKYVEDPRNDCKLQQEIPLFNHMVHVSKSDYKPKVLRTYLCANGLTAANISED